MWFLPVHYYCLNYLSMAFLIWFTVIYCCLSQLPVSSGSFTHFSLIFNSYHFYFHLQTPLRHPPTFLSCPSCLYPRAYSFIFFTDAIYRSFYSCLFSFIQWTFICAVKCKLLGVPLRFLFPYNFLKRIVSFLFHIQPIATSSLGKISF